MSTSGPVIAASSARFALRHAKVLAFVAVVLAILGVRAYLIAPQSMFPAMSFARVDVVADAGDLPPDRVRIAVTLPLERQLQSLPGLQRLRATSSQGAAELLLDFDASSDPRVDQQVTEAALARARAGIPAAKSIDAVVVNADAEPVLSYAFTSTVLSQAALRGFIESRVVPAFAGTTGLGRVSAVGGPPIEYRVDLDGAALAASRLAASDVSAAIAQANDVLSVGTTERYHARYALLVDASIHDAPSLAALNIPTASGASVPLGALGRVRLGTGLAVAQAGTNGRPAVVLNAFALASADEVTLARAFRARLAAVDHILPADVRVTAYWDKTRLIVDSQASLRDAILIGALLAVVVIAVFLRDLRMTLIAAAIIPLAMAIAVLVLERSGQSLNLMSVGGLAVAVGLIIDDAIVVIEAIARGIADHPSRAIPDTIADAAGRLAVPMTVSTATTLVVFVPLGLLTGITGFFFRALAFTLSISLIVSLALALFITPLLAAAFVRAPHVHEASALTARYQAVLRWALAHRGRVFGAAGLVLVTTIVLLARLPSDFLPALDEGEFEIKYTLPPGATLADSDAAAARMERIVRADPAVAAEGRLTGVDTNGFSPTLPGVGTIRVALVGGARPSYDVISGRIRDAIGSAVPVASLDLHQLLEDQINDLSGAPQPVEVAITGPDPRQLNVLARATAGAVAHIPGVVDAFDGVVLDDPTVRFTPLTARIAALQLGGGEVNDALDAAAQGTVATYVPATSGSVVVPVRVRVADVPGAFDVAPLFTKNGVVPAGAIAAIARTPAAAEINDENGSQIVRVTANIEGASLSAVSAAIAHAIETLPHPPGYAYTIGGAYATQQASFREFISVVGIAIVLVFSIMLAAFGSFRLPLVIVVTIPFALIGVAVALAITGTPINVSSFMGLLLLVGLVVKNGILLIDVANKRRVAGDDVATALLVAGSTRVRPIVMTTLAAIGGLVPLALGFGAGAEMERPLAIAVIGGLSTATAFTLVLIPVLYATMLGRAPRRAFSAALSALLVVVLAASANAQTIDMQTDVHSAPATLDDAERAAVLRSPDVRAVRAALIAAQASAAAVRGANGFAVTAGYLEAPQGAPEGTIAQRVTSYGLQWNIGDLSARNPLVAQADAVVRGAVADELAAERTERAKVVGLYFTARKAHATLAARTDDEAGTRRFVDAAAIRFRTGDAPRLDTIRADVALARAFAATAAARAADANAIDALVNETAITADRFTDASALDAVATPLPDVTIAVARALAQRADLRSADEAVRAANAAVSAARRAALPPLTLAGGYDQGVDSGYRIAGPTVNVQLAIPLSGTPGARVHVQAALVDEAIARRDAIELGIRTDVAAAARTATAAVEGEAATLHALAAAREELDATTTGYRAGASTSLELAAAHSAYEQVAIEALTARFDRLQSAALLDLAVAP